MKTLLWFTRGNARDRRKMRRIANRAGYKIVERACRYQFNHKPL